MRLGLVVSLEALKGSRCQIQVGAVIAELLLTFFFGEGMSGDPTVWPTNRGRGDESSSCRLASKLIQLGSVALLVFPHPWQVATSVTRTS